MSGNSDIRSGTVPYILSSRLAELGRVIVAQTAQGHHLNAAAERYYLVHFRNSSTTYAQ